MNDLSPLGHNSERELDLIANDARHGLDLVAAGEGKSVEGWLIYGAALNAGRERFPSNEQFGQWVRLCQLDTNGRHDRAAAMWAAANPIDFAKFRESTDARTVRGIHDKWKEEQDRLVYEQAKQEAAEAKRKAKEAEREAKQAEAAARAEADERARIEAEKVAAESRAAAEKAQADAEEKKKLEKAAKKGKKSFVENNTGNNEWYTPPKFIDAARIVLGQIDLDPASSEIANQTVGASRIFTEQDDGLTKDWHGTVWMNPPYASGLVGPFCEKFALSFRAGDITEGIVLVNNASETGWWQALAEASSAICFPKSRVKFLRNSGEVGAPLQGQTIFYAGTDPIGFKDAFAEFGFVVFCG